jgi:hypothetical protein
MWAGTTRRGDTSPACTRCLCGRSGGRLARVKRDAREAQGSAVTSWVVAVAARHRDAAEPAHHTLRISSKK